MPVAGEKIDLCDIIPTGYIKESYVGGSISIQLLDYQGYAVEGSTYRWFDDEDGTAWFDAYDEEVKPRAVTYNPGDALWVQGNAATESLRSSGEVANGSIDVYLRAGAMLVNNPMPVAIPFNDDNKDGKFIAPSGYIKDSYVGGSISAQKLDYQGYAVEGSTYRWFDDEDGTAWFDAYDEEVEGEALQPGEAIWVQANSTSEKLNFPSPLQKDL